MNIIITGVKLGFNNVKQNHPNIDDAILKSALVHQCLYLINFDDYVSIEDVLEINNNEIGLIGPGNGCLTKILERLFGWSDILRSHGILHDAYGRFYTHHSSDRGYIYILPENKTPECMKRSPLCGHISGLIYCAFKRIRI